MTALPPIPSYLPPWQAPHLAWLAVRGRPIRYAVLDSVEAVRADLRGANLSGADLSCADLSGADLRGADLREADLSCAYLSGANLSGADLSGAELHSSYLSFANFASADLHGANLGGADLSGANLSEARLVGADMTWAYMENANLCGAHLIFTKLHDAYGISHIGPVGRRSTTVYAVMHDNGPMIRAEDWWGSAADIMTRIRAEYADDPAARDRYIAAVRAVAALVTP